MYKVRAAVGELITVDARTERDHWLMEKINARRTGSRSEAWSSVIGTSFHGDGALRIMAELGNGEGIYNRTNEALFHSPSFLARLIYPLLRGALSYPHVARCRQDQKSRCELIAMPVQRSLRRYSGTAGEELPPGFSALSQPTYSNDLTIVRGRCMCGFPVGADGFSLAATDQNAGSQVRRGCCCNREVLQRTRQ
ncbi:MAG: hypothetical protein R3D32_03415 [Nitratireductor sp.]